MIISGILGVGILSFVIYYTTTHQHHHHKKPPHHKIMTKEARESLILPNNAQVNNLYDLAHNVRNMSDHEFSTVTNKIPEWVTKSLDHPQLGAALSLVNSREETYRHLYNIYVNEFSPDEKPIFKVKEALLNTDFNKHAEMPVRLHNHILFNIDNLMETLPEMSEEEFTINKPIIEKWINLYGEHLKNVVKDSETKEALHSRLKEIKVEQEIYKIIKN